MTQTPTDPRDRMIVALDVPSVTEAEKLVARLDDSVSFYKIGYQLAYAGGLPMAHDLVRAGKKVFIDLKLHDIGNTVASGVAGIAKLGATFLTVHAYPQTMKAAVEASRGSGLQILAVTVLTSMNNDTLDEIGVGGTVADQVMRLAILAKNSGMNGVVCSAWEAQTLKQALGADFKLVTPGIRLADDKADDQQRICTPKQAMENGSDYLVIGRPITGADNPTEKLKQILATL